MNHIIEMEIMGSHIIDMQNVDYLNFALQSLCLFKNNSKRRVSQCRSALLKRSFLFSLLCIVFIVIFINITR